MLRRSGSHGSQDSEAAHAADVNNQLFGEMLKLENSKSLGIARSRVRRDATEKGQLVDERTVSPVIDLQHTDCQVDLESGAANVDGASHGENIEQVSAQMPAADDGSLLMLHSRFRSQQEGAHNAMLIGDQQIQDEHMHAGAADSLTTIGQAASGVVSAPVLPDAQFDSALHSVRHGNTPHSWEEETPAARPIIGGNLTPHAQGVSLPGSTREGGLAGCPPEAAQAADSSPVETRPTKSVKLQIDTQPSFDFLADDRGGIRSSRGFSKGAGLQGSQRGESFLDVQPDLDQGTTQMRSTFRKSQVVPEGLETVIEPGVESESGARSSKGGTKRLQSSALKQLFYTSPTEKPPPSLRSALKSSATRSRVKARRVRFRGIPSDTLLQFVGFLIRHFRPGSSTLQLWDRVIAIVTTIDFFMIPVVSVVSAVTNDQALVLHASLVNFLGRRLITATLCMDTVFLLHILVQVAQSSVNDLGFMETAIDKIVGSAELEPTGEDSEQISYMQMAQSAFAQGGSMLGDTTRRTLSRLLPFHVSIMAPLWLAQLIHLPEDVINLSLLTRLGRVRILTRYFAERQADLSSDVKMSAFFKFTFIILATGHWIGCIYYYLAALTAFSGDSLNMNWVTAWVQQTFIDFKWWSASYSSAYIVILFKGFSMLTGMGYEDEVPFRAEEIVLALICQNIKIVMDAYVLGTLFHYLVKKDPEIEMNRQRMLAMGLYCEERHLPAQLRDKIQAYFKFQQQHSNTVTDQVMTMMPSSLQARVAQQQCRHTLARNHHLLGGCTDTFLDRLMITLTEISLMPGECILKQGEIARELSFVSKGTIRVTDERGTLMELITGEGTSPCVIGSVSFLMGIPEPYNIHARENEKSALLSISKATFSELVLTYPDQLDILMTSLLQLFGLTRDGEDAGTTHSSQNDEGVMLMRDAIKASLKRSQAMALGQLIVAASEGDVETVEDIVARGVNVDQGDYDGRTTLHVAISEKRIEIVTLLLDKGAKWNVVDTWGMSPLLAALSIDELGIAEALCAKGAMLGEVSLDFLLDAAASEEKLRLLCTKAGVSINMVDVDGKTALHHACALRKWRSCQNLLNLGADVNAADRLAGTPVEDAVRSKDTVLVNMLSDTGARPSTPFLRQAILAAAREGDIKTLQLLHSMCADLSVSNYDKLSGMHVAARDGQIAFLFSICTLACEDVNPRDIWGWTPLDHAVMAEQWGCAVLLLSQGGELTVPGLQERVREAAAQKRVPALSPLRKDLRNILRSRNSTLVALCSPAGSVDPAVLAAKDGMRKQVMAKTLQMLSSVADRIDDLRCQLDDISSLCFVMKRLLLLSLPPPSGKKGFGRSLSRTASKVGTLQEDSHSVTDSRKAALRSTIMHMFMRANIIETCMMKFMELTHAHLRTLDVEEDKLDATFEFLDLNASAVDRAECNNCLTGPEGSKQLSLIALLLVPSFQAQVELQHAAEAGAGFAPLKAEVDDNGADINTAAAKLHDQEWQNDDTDDLNVILQRLATIYIWTGEIFAALDLQSKGFIDLNRSGPALFSIFSELKISHLWDSLQSSLNGDAKLTRQKFTAVFFLWMGVDEQFELSCQQADVADDCGDLYGSIGGNSLDDAEATQANQADEKDTLDGSALEQLLRTRDLNLQDLLSLSPLEWLKWRMGIQIPMHQLSSRLFDALDVERVGLLPVDSLEYIINFLSRDFPIGKATTDIVQATIRDKEANIIVAVSLERFTEILDTCGSSKRSVALPRDAQPFILHPDSALVWFWEWVMLGVACGYFWEVPFGIAFDVPHRLKTLSAVISYSSLLLVVNICISFCRAFYSRSGAVEYRLIEIRRQYMAGPFIFDMLSTIPFREVVAAFGSGDHKYVTWLQLPRMFACWRIVTLLQELQKRTGKVSMTTSIARLLVLLTCMNHVVGCAWWYLGTVYIPEGFDGSRPDGWHRHSAIPSSTFLEENQETANMTSYLQAPAAMNSSTSVEQFLEHHVTPDHPSDMHAAAGNAAQGLIQDVGIDVSVIATEAGDSTSAHGTSGNSVGSVDLDNKIPTIYIGGAWVPLTEPVPSVDEPASFDSWVMYYQGLGVGQLWPDSVNVLSQYGYSFYWAASTLSTAGMIGYTTPKNQAEVLFSILCMMITMTLYAYVLGEISNQVIASGEALVHTRDQLSIVRTFISRRMLPKDLATDIVSTFFEKISKNQDTERIFGSLSSSLRVEVAMHISLPLVKESEIFKVCSNGFITALSVLMQEVTYMADETVFRAKEACNDLFLIATQGINLMTAQQDGSELNSGSRHKGELLGDVAFFFRLRHLYSAVVGKSSSTLFKMGWEDYQQIAVTYVEDASRAVEQVIATLDDTGNVEKSQSSMNSATSVGEGNTKVKSTIEDAVKRQNSEATVAILDSVADGDIEKVDAGLRSGKVAVDDADYDSRTALHVAASLNRVEIAEMLLNKYSATHTVRDRFGGQPLDDAIRKRNSDMVELLTTSRQAVLPQSAEYARKLVDAAATNDVTMLDNLLKAGVSPNCCGEDHRTALHMCVPSSCYEAAERLLAHPDTHVGPLDRLGHTPLWDAISFGDEKLAKVLYEKGAPLQQNCAAQVCQRAAENDCAFLECMLNLNLPVNMRDAYGRTPLHTAVTSGAFRTADALLQKQPELAHSVDIFGQTPLDNAVTKGYDIGVALLKRVGGMSGSDSRMAEVARSTAQWAADQQAQRQAAVLQKAISQIPEKKLCDGLAAVVDAFKAFLEVGYTSMMIMSGSLQQKLAAGHTSGLSAPCDERLKEVIRGMVRSCMDLKDILVTPAQEYGVLLHSLVRNLGRSEFQAQLNSTASSITEVLSQLKRMRSVVGKAPLKLPEQNVDQLRSVLSMGPYQYLQVPLPRDHGTMNLEDLSQVRVWRRQVVTEHHSSQKDLEIIPPVKREQTGF